MFKLLKDGFMIQQIRIQNFRSLKNVTLNLQQVNLLIGPNNSGKTNLLKALVFLKGILQLSINGGDFEKNIFRKNSLLGFDFTLVGDDFPIEFSINYGWEENSESLIPVFFQLLIRGPRTFKGLIGIKREETSIDNLKSDSYSKKEELDVYFLNYQAFDQSGLNIVSDESNYRYLNDIYVDLLKLLNNLVIYKPNPEKFTASSEISSANTLNADGSNIIPFLFSLSQNHKKKFKQLEEDLKNCVGDIVSVSTPPDPAENGKLKLKFFDAYDNDYWAEEVSEGVLYFLALLCIIHQPNPPRLLLLEEPEKGIHPRRIREVMDFIFGLAEEKGIQIIMTTHDTYVVDQFADLPESVFVFEKKEGATSVKNLLKDIIEPSNKINEEKGLPLLQYTESLGEHWAAGFLGGVPQ